MAVFIHIWLMTNNTEYFLYAYLYPDIFFDDVFVQIFCTFKNFIFSFIFLLRIDDSLHILDANSLRDT